MRTLILLVALFSSVALAKEFKMPCTEYEQLTGEKVCDVSATIQITSEEVEFIKETLNNRNNTRPVLLTLRASIPSVFRNIIKDRGENASCRTSVISLMNLLKQKLIKFAPNLVNRYQSLKNPQKPITYVVNPKLSRLHYQTTLADRCQEELLIHLQATRHNLPSRDWLPLLAQLHRPSHSG